MVRLTKMRQSGSPRGEVTPGLAATKTNSETNFILSDDRKTVPGVRDVRSSERGMFPTSNRRAHPDTYGPVLQAEGPLLLDPCLDDPDRHLAFSEDGKVLPRGKSRRGFVTIEVLDLNRSGLLSARGERAQQVKELLMSCFRAAGEGKESGAGGLASLIKELESCCDESQAFAGMARQLLRGWLSAANSVPMIEMPSALTRNPDWQGLVELLLPQPEDGVEGESSRSYITGAKTGDASEPSGAAEGERVQGRADVGIIIALQEEFDELFDAIKGRCTHIRDPETGNYNYLFEHESTHPSHHYHCVATLVGGMGHSKAGLAAQKLIHDYKPHTLVILGLAASLSADIKLGDAVVADVVDAYMENSRAEGQDAFVLKFGGEPYRSSADWVKHALNFRFAFRENFKSWQEQSATELLRVIPDEGHLLKLVADGTIRERVDIFIGHLASGSTVGASTAFTAWLKGRDRKYIALEMESAGVMAAAWDAVRPVQTLVLRAISDFGDERKAALDQINGGAFRRYAIRNAIHLLWHFLDTK
jgi:nucleoside phosphorylase